MASALRRTFQAATNATISGAAAEGQVCRLQFQSLGLSPGATPQLNHSTPPLVLPAMPASHHVDRNMARHISGNLVACLPNSSHISSLSSSSRHASPGCRPHGSRGRQNLNGSLQRATPSARHRRDILQPTPRSSSTALRTRRTRGTRRTRQMADVEVTRCDLGDLAAEGFRKETPGVSRSFLEANTKLAACFLQVFENLRANQAKLIKGRG